MELVGKPPPCCGQQIAGFFIEDKTGQNMDKGQWETETFSPYMSWNKEKIEKNPTAEPGILPERRCNGLHV